MMSEKKITKKITKPMVSIIMPVFNAEAYMRQALDSVLAQTYQDFEIIAINDGSRDGSLKILRAYAKLDRRIKVHTRAANNGVAHSANEGVAYAKGKFIARMDADDLIPVDRIEKQVEFLLANPRVIVVGGQVELMTENGDPIVVKQFPLAHKEIVDMAFIAMPIQQGAMMVNKQLLPADFVWYRYNYKTSEDLDFFFRAFMYGQGANLSDTVLYYRQHGASITQAGDPKKIFFTAHKVRMNAFKHDWVNPSPKALVLSMIQYILVFCMPSGIVYPLYYLWRGLQPFAFPRYGLKPLLLHVKNYII